MTREQFECAGYKVLSCKANGQCFNVDHVHCQLTEGAEYCPNSRRILVLSTFIIGKPVHQLPMGTARLCAATIVGVFKELHPDWELKDVAFV